MGEKPAEITRTEDVLLRERLRTEARAAKNAVVMYKRGQAFLETIEKEIKRAFEVPRGKERSRISFIRQLGEFKQPVITEIKNELGITKSFKEMGLEELQSFVEKAKERLRFKFSRGYRPSAETTEKLNIKPKESLKPVLDENFYQSNREISATKKTLKEKTVAVGRGIGESAEKILTPISTRLENIDPSLKQAMRKFEWNTMRGTQKDLTIGKSYLKKTKASVFGKMSKNDFADLDLALKNGDIKKIAEINQRYGAGKEYQNIKTMLDDLYRRANEVGYDIGYQKDYWPRMVKDSEGLLEYFGKSEYKSIIEEAVKRKEMDLGRYLTAEEKANLINTMIRGYQGGQITLSATGAMKNRVIDLITPEINQFYHDSRTSLVRYIEQTNDAIAARKFFGKGNKLDRYGNIDDSIGAYVADLLAKGKITPSQEMTLRDILNARFNPKGTHGIVGLYKNLSYIDVMGSPYNAITQLGDLAFSIYKNGFWSTLKTATRSLIGKSKIKKEDIGIENIAQEFSNGGKVGKAVDTVFKLTGLNKMDRLGKESLINGSISKYQKLAKNPTPEFLNQMKKIFGNDMEKVLTDLKNGTITEDVKYLAFNDLLDFQPAALSEMPEQYLKGGNGRIFYMLKSYTLKSFDVFRRESFREIARGNVVKGISNFLKLASLLVLANGTADEIKDFILGRKTSLKDRTIDELAKLAGFSRYSLGRITEEGLGKTLAEQIIPPTNVIDNLSKDLMNLYKNYEESANINELKSVQDIPLIGKFYYWWFGKGKQSKEETQRTEKKKAEQKPIQSIYDQAQKLNKEGKLDQAQKLVNDLSEEDYKIYKDIKSNEKRKETEKEVEKMLPRAKKILQLKMEGKLDEATKQVEAMTDEEYRLYKLAKGRLE